MANHLMPEHVISDRPSADDERGRVLRFRLRGVPSAGGWVPRGLGPSTLGPSGRLGPGSLGSGGPVDDLARYEQADGDDSYRHRMLMNAIAFAITAMLIVSGVWLTSKILEIRNEQDCYLSGRRNCAPIEIPHHG
jgi:hypothetical protein